MEKIGLRCLGCSAETRLGIRVKTRWIRIEVTRHPAAGMRRTRAAIESLVQWWQNRCQVEGCIFEYVAIRQAKIVAQV